MGNGALAIGTPTIHADSETGRRNAARVVDFFEDILATGHAVRAADYLSAGFVDHDSESGAGAVAAGVVARLKAMWATFPDGRFTLEAIVAAGDLVAVRSIFRGTQTGALGALAPTGKTVTVSFMDFYRMAGGMLAEHWHDFDQSGMMAQLNGSR